MDTKALAAALAKAQAQFVQPKKNKTVTVRPKNGNAYSFDYADYSEIVESVRGPLSQNGIAFTHSLEFRESKLFLVTRLIHGSTGEQFESIWPMTSSDDPKEVGGDMTYGKRYSLSAITGCVADDDADADPKHTESFTDRKPTHTAPAKMQTAFAASFHETDLPIETDPRSQNPVVIKTGAGPKPNNQVAEDGKKWSSFWPQTKAAGWEPDEVHTYAESKWGVKSLTELSPQNFQALVLHTKTFPPVRKQD